MKKIEASTLTEVIVALTIITLVTAMFFSIIIQVGNYHKNRQRIIIEQQLIEIINEAKLYGRVDDETLEMDGYYFIKTLKPYKDITDIWEIKVEAFSFKDKLISKHNAIFKLTEIIPD